MRTFLLRDAGRAFFAGLGIAVLALPVFYNLKLATILPEAFRGHVVFLLIGWLATVPVLSAFGLYVLHYLVAERQPTLFQIGKYGIVGLLNSFLCVSVFNILILATDIAHGFIIDLFSAIAFVIAVTNSYFWNRSWVFEGKRSLKTVAEYRKFFFVTALVAVLNIIIIHIFVNSIGAPSGLDKKVWANLVLVIMIPVSFFGNYFGYRIFVFKL